MHGFTLPTFHFIFYNNQYVLLKCIKNNFAQEKQKFFPEHKFIIKKPINYRIWKSLIDILIDTRF